MSAEREDDDVLAAALDINVETTVFRQFTTVPGRDQYADIYVEGAVFMYQRRRKLGLWGAFL